MGKFWKGPGISEERESPAGIPPIGTIGIEWQRESPPLLRAEENPSILSSLEIENPNMDEREFYTEKSQIKHATYTCPKCHETAEFEIHWLHRMKRKTLPPGADDRDRAKFAKAGDYLVRVDEYLVCPNPRCRSRFEIPDLQTVVLL
jgi:hypothetical protein